MNCPSSSANVKYPPSFVRTSSQWSIARSIFLHLRELETERYTQEKHEIKSFDLQEIYEFNFSFLWYLASFQSYGSLKKIGARNTYFTDGTDSSFIWLTADAREFGWVGNNFLLSR